MIHSSWQTLAGREFFCVTIAGQPTDTPALEARIAIEAAVGALEAAGFSPQNLVRSRLFARDAQVRRIASDVRLDVLKGTLRSASSSYVDAQRLSTGSSMSIDLVALRTKPGSTKHVREYASQIAPPMFVTIDGCAFLSGVTDMSDQFDAQLICIRDTVLNSVAQAGGTNSGIVNIDAHISRKLGANHAWAAISALFPGSNARVSLTQVDGYSAPQKLVELEIMLQLAQ